MSSAEQLDDFQEFLLDTPDAVDQAIFHGPEAKLGGAEPDLALRRVRLRIGRRPIVHNMRRLYEALSVEYPKDLKLFEQYEVWLFSLRLHLLKDGGFNSVRKLGCQVKYPEDYAVSIVSQLPDSEFITRAGGQVKTSAIFTVTGDVKIPVIGASAGKASVQIGGGIHAEASADAHLTLSFSVMSDKIVATGTGDYLGEWSVKRGDQPLLGEQCFLNAVLVPKSQTQLALEMRAYVAVGTPYLVPARLNTDWIKVVLPLDANASVGIET